MWLRLCLLPSDQRKKISGGQILGQLFSIAVTPQFLFNPSLANLDPSLRLQASIAAAILCMKLPNSTCPFYLVFSRSQMN